MYAFKLVTLVLLLAITTTTVVKELNASRIERTIDDYGPDSSSSNNNGEGGEGLLAHRFSIPMQSDVEDLSPGGGPVLVPIDAGAGAAAAGAEPDLELDKNANSSRRDSTVLCPRSNNLIPPTSLLGQECSQKCVTSDDCDGSNEICTCDGDCGLSCVDPSKCKYLPSAPFNGMVIGSKNEEEGMRAVFICNDGFSLVDGPSWKPCANGEWVPKDKMPKCVSTSNMVLRRKRKAIKTGGSSVLRSKYGSGGGGGGGRRTFRKKRPGVEGVGEEEDDGITEMICEDLDPLIDVEVIESGKYDDGNDTYSDGAVLNVSCGAGHFVNLAGNVARCVKGEWKPKLPQCKALPCKVPYIEHGWCYEGSKMLYFEELIRYGKSINIHCLPRFKLKGISKMVCQFGEWEISGGYPPECLPAPCLLPAIQYGAYTGAFVPGMNATHETEVDYTCGGDFRKMHEGPAHCNMGEWKPEKPYCVHPSIDLNYASSNSIVKVNGSRRSCLMPPAEKGAVLYVDGRPLDPEENSRFIDGTYVLYKCVGHPGNKTLKRNRWIRTCTDGGWSGSPLPCDGEVDHELIQGLLETINSSCFYGDRESNLVLFLNNKKQVDNKTDEFSTGSVITSRCSDIGKFEFRGAVHRKCVSGQWLGTTPKCEGLSQLHDYALDKNPTILFRFVNGSIGQSNTGELVVYPGTTVHMECLWIRKFGPPRWEVKRNGLNVTTKYAQGWTDGIPDRFQDLEYRITIPNADSDDTASYTCKTPSRHTHSVKIVVEATTCPELQPRNSLSFSTRERHLGVEVNLTCDNGYSLFGEKNVTCLANGQWSAPLPRCEKLKVKCQDPPELENGIVSGTPPYKPGDLAHFECKYGYMMEGGQAVSVCQDNGKWSKVPGLECHVACTYPGSIVGGTITPVKFYYKVQETITFDCVEGYELKGAAMVHCLGINGAHWSNSLPTCIRTTGT